MVCFSQFFFYLKLNFLFKVFTWLVSFCLVQENNNSYTMFDLFFCVGLVLQGHFIFIYHIYMCRCRKNLLFLSKKRHKFDTLFNLIRKNQKPSQLNKMNNIFTIPVEMKKFEEASETLAKRPGLFNFRGVDYDSNINSLSYLYGENNANRIKKKYLSSKSSLASSLYYIHNQRKNICKKFNQNKKMSGRCLDPFELAKNDVPSRIDRLNDSLKRIKFKNSRNRFVHLPFDLSIGQIHLNSSKSSPSQRTKLFAKSDSFKLTNFSHF